MSKNNGTLNGWGKIILVALLAGSVPTAGTSLLGKPRNVAAPIVTSEQWTELNKEVARLTEAVENVEKTLARLIPKP